MYIFAAVMSLWHQRYALYTEAAHEREVTASSQHMVSAVRVQRKEY